MKYIINEVLRMVDSCTLDSEIMIRVDEFEDLDVYRKIAESVTDALKGRSVRVSIKLANNKWERLKAGADTSTVQEMEKNGWVIHNESVTDYRNRHDSNVLVLMGTEEEEDQDGLANFASIDRESLIRSLNKHYSRAFTELSQNYNDDSEELKCIDALYDALFHYRPIDIVKFSDVADAYEASAQSVNEIIAFFYRDLPMWGLPMREENIPSIAKIIQKSKSLLKSAHEFITRAKYKKITVNGYAKIEKQFEIYKADPSSEFGPAWDGWAAQKISNYEDYRECVLRYIRGVNTASDKELLLGTDFAIAEDILNLKISSGPPKETIGPMTVVGEPVQALMQAWLNMLLIVSENEENASKVTDIVLEVNSAAIVCDYAKIDDLDAEQNLLDRWNVITRHVNGIDAFINSREWKLSDHAVRMTIAPQDVFSPVAGGNFISSQLIGASRNINEIDFSAKCLDVDGNPVKITLQEVQWKFDSQASWLFDFEDICQPDIFPLSAVQSGKCIPIAQISHMDALVFSKNEEEYFDNYKDETLDFSYDVLKAAESKCTACAPAFLTDLEGLGSDFYMFIRDISCKGLYCLMTEHDSSLSKLILTYIKACRSIASSSIPDNIRWLQMAFVYAFTIAKNPAVIEKDEEPDCCIVPSWHPAALEKLCAQKWFILEGCNEYWNDAVCAGRKESQKNIRSELEQIVDMCQVRDTLDIFPHDASYYGSTGSYGSFTVYSVNGLRNETRIRDIIKKEAVFDDDFKTTNYSQMTDDAHMYFDVMEDYTRAYHEAFLNLHLVFINPSDLQPVVASVFHYCDLHKNDNTQINITIKILVSPENKGGRNYLSYWMDELFSKNEQVNVKTYLNIWQSKEDIAKFLDDNNDIIFILDLLKNVSLQLPQEDGYIGCSDTDTPCYPIVQKPSPVAQSSVKRRIEITQPQFKAEYAHTQVVCHTNAPRTPLKKDGFAIREIKIDKDSQDIIYELHQKAYWVVCIDSCIDGALLKTDDEHKDTYNIIGFSTGKGCNGKFNLTITSRKSIIETLRTQFENRLKQLFGWPESEFSAATDRILTEACRLDGISLLSAVNQYSGLVNEFMAYVLTSLREKQMGDTSPLKTVIHLDSYKHWFADNKTSTSGASRPDFLIVEIVDTSSPVLKLKATVVECKIAQMKNMDARKEDAMGQMQNGLAIFRKIFDPQSSSIRRRYWYAQLYRALAFAQVTFQDTDAQFQIIVNKLRGILDGKFKIRWSAELLGYWFDMPGTDEIVNPTEEPDIVMIDIPQERIQEILLGSRDQVSYVDQIDPDLLMDEAEEEEAICRREEEIQKQREEEDKKRRELREKKHQEYRTEEKAKPSDNEGIEQEKAGENQESENKNSHQDNEQDKTHPAPNLKNIRILIGKNKYQSDLFWEFGRLGNRHLLITGNSGQGKTYLIQCMLYEAASTGISSFVIDYTNGFTPDQLDPEFKHLMGNRIKERIVYKDKISINPFTRQKIQIGSDDNIDEDNVSIANRIRDVFGNVYRNFGNQQSGAIYEAAKNGLDTYGDQMNFSRFEEELKGLNTQYSRTVLSTMKPFLDMAIFSAGEHLNWDEILYPSVPQMYIFQLTGYPQVIQKIITYMLLWDAYYYTVQHGVESHPFIAVLDEAQNLSHGDESPSGKILLEGRKKGWSAWYATQSLDMMADDEITRLQQAACRVYFRPTDSEIKKVSELLDPANKNRWINEVKSLTKGNCIVSEDRLRSDGQIASAPPMKVHVVSLEERSKSLNH